MIDLANALPAEATGCGRSSSDVKVVEVETNRRYCCMRKGECREDVDTAKGGWRTEERGGRKNGVLSRTTLASRAGSLSSTRLFWAKAVRARQVQSFSLALSSTGSEADGRSWAV